MTEFHDSTEDIEIAGRAFNRLTRIADTMGKAMFDHAEYDEEMRALVLVECSRGDGRSDAATGMFGYDEDDQEATILALSDAIIHVQALAKAVGLDIVITGMPKGMMN